VICVEWDGLVWRLLPPVSLALAAFPGLTYTGFSLGSDGGEQRGVLRMPGCEASERAMLSVIMGIETWRRVRLFALILLPPLIASCASCDDGPTHKHHHGSSWFRRILVAGLDGHDPKVAAVFCHC
jgi:hypothetical protein